MGATRSDKLLAEGNHDQKSEGARLIPQVGVTKLPIQTQDFEKEVAPNVSLPTI